MKKIFNMLMAVAIAACTFTACEDVPEPYTNPYNQSNNGENNQKKEIDPTGTGTEADPFNVAAALLKCEEVGEAGTTGDVYCAGIVTAIKEISTSYGNAEFTISDDAAGSNALTVFRAVGPNKEKITNENLFKVGDKVVICGKLVNYKGNTPEFTQGCYIVSITAGENGNNNQPTTDGGTLEKPFTVAQALAKCAEVGEAGTTTDVYTLGIVTDIKSISLDYGNAEFTISDDEAGSNALLVYRAVGPEKKKITDENLIKKGDKVLICGKLVNYKGNTPEYTQGCYIVSINDNGNNTPSPEGAKGTGTLQDPFNAIAATKEAQKLSSGQVSSQAYYIKGKVAKIAVDKNNNVQNFDYGTFGNASFYISDDGKDANTFYCYRVLYLDNKKWEQGAGDVLAVNDEVIVCAKLTMYNTTAETAQNEGYLYSLNGKTSSGGNNNTPTGDVIGTKDNPVTVARALSDIDKLNDGDTSKEFYYIKGTIKTIKTAADKIAQYKNIDYIITDDGNNELTVFRGKNLNNTDFTAAGQIEEGDEVVVYGQLQKYKNTSGTIVPEVAQGNYLVALTKKSGGGNNNPSTGGDETGTNGDFETWNGDTPVNWTTASSAGTATLSKSTVAHSGTYAVEVAGNTSSNKRMAYKELSLKAGDYTMKFYAKSASSEIASIRPGFVPVTDGSVGSYTYPSSYVNVPPEWQLYEQALTIPSDGTYCVLIMVSKTPGLNVIIDDFTLTKGNDVIIK